MRCSTAASSLVLVALTAGCDVDLSAGKVSRCALGAHAESPNVGLADALTTFEGLIGRSVDIDRQYYKLDDIVPGDHERWTAEHGRLPLVSVTSGLLSGARISWARIADPSDAEARALVTALARRLRELQHPILVIFHDEAQNDGAFGTPDEFVAAWRHVVEVARAEGADNVAWVWSLSSSGFPTVADAWYPGDEWVDWIATTGFNWYTGDPVSQWRTFPSIFAPFYEWSAGRGRPLLIASVSSAENPNETEDGARSKATWIREALETLEGWPEIQGLVWLHAPSDNPFRDWSADSSPAALAAFRELAASPHLDVGAKTPP